MLTNSEVDKISKETKVDVRLKLNCSIDSNSEQHVLIQADEVLYCMSWHGSLLRTNSKWTVEVHKKT